MKGIFTHNPLFRILFPFFYGLLVYVLVLLIFDGISQLENNFFSQEALFCVVLTYALSESLSLVLRFINYLFPEFRSVRRRIFIYLATNLFCAFIVISGGVTAYFVLLIGYPDFQVELIVFNLIFFVTTLLYTAVYFGIFYLNHFNQRRLEQETALREKMEYQLGALKSDINPQLLYASLETLITLVHHNPDQADKFINCLSKIYRYSLEYRRHELAPLEQEIQAAENVVELYNYSYKGQIRLHLQIDTDIFNKQLIPGTLQKLAEQAISRSLISARKPLQLYLKIGSLGQLVWHYDLNEKLLLPPATSPDLITHLRQSYGFFTQQPLEYNESQNQVTIRIPFLQSASKEAPVTNLSRSGRSEYVTESIAINPIIKFKPPPFISGSVRES